MTRYLAYEVLDFAANNEKYRIITVNQDKYIKDDI